MTFDPKIAREQEALNREGANLVVDGLDGPAGEAAREEFRDPIFVEAEKRVASMVLDEPAMTDEGRPRREPSRGMRVVSVLTSMAAALMPWLGFGRPSVEARSEPKSRPGPDCPDRCGLECRFHGKMHAKRLRRAHAAALRDTRRPK